MARTLERASLSIVRRLQKLNPRYALGVLGADEVRQMLRACNTREVEVQSLPSVALWTPPYEGGANLLLIQEGTPYTLARFAALRTLAQHELGDAPPLAAYVAAACGVLNLEDVQRKGLPFIRRKQVALLTAPDAFWEGYSATYVLRVATRVSIYLAANPRRVTGAVRRSARYQVDLGRVALAHRRYPSALRHYAQAASTAALQADIESLALAYIGTGKVYRAQGELSLSSEYFHRAAALGLSEGRPDLAARAYHDLAAVAMEVADHALADEYLMLAGEHYPIHDHRRLTLFADGAYLWIEQGFGQRALRVLSALLPRFPAGSARTQMLAMMARAAAQAGEKRMYERLWPVVDAASGSNGLGADLLRARVELANAHYEAGELARGLEVARVVYRMARRAGERGIAREVRRCAADAKRGLRQRAELAASAGTHQKVDDFAARIISELAVPT